MTRYLILGCLVVLTSQRPVFTEEPKSLRQEAVRDKWIARITADLPKVAEKERSSAAQFAVVALAEAGEVDRAKMFVRKFLPAKKRPGTLLLIVMALATQDRLKEALEMVGTLPKDYRDAGYSWIVVRQAQRGDLKDARAHFPKIKSRSKRDFVLASIAKAEAVNREFDRARKTLKRIADKDRRWETRETINRIQREKTTPIKKLRSPFLRQQLRALLAFSGSEGQREAIDAIIAAQNKDRVALAKHIKAALKRSDKLIPLERATTRTLLAVALVEAGRSREARKMLLAARQAGKGEWLGVSSLFGSPILVHLLIRLKMDDELESLMKSINKNDEIDRIPFHANLQAIGATFAELGRFKDAEKRYRQTKSPLERVHLAVGVVSGLRKGS